jgi:outer membrane receptor protein involved in Fe transport
MTDETGGFKLENIGSGNYLVRISFIGYETAYSNADVPQQSDLGEIRLTEKANKLDEVVVTAQRPLIERRIDRYVVNVSSHLLTPGRNALEVLRNTPGLLVSSGGSITIANNAVEIWIDGRPSNLSGEQLRSLLTSMQGETIDRIEVITNPSSRYDAAGIGGIVNIRTKKGLQYGLNGSTNAGYKQSHVDVENAGLQLNYRSRAANLFGNYGITRQNNYNGIKQINIVESQEGAVTFDQYASSKNQRSPINHQFRVGADFFLSSKSTLGFLLNDYENGKEEELLEGETDITPSSEGINHTSVRSLSRGSGSGRQANVNFQQTFSRPEQQLNIDLDMARFASDPSQEITNMYDGQDVEQAGRGVVEQLRHANPQIIDIRSGKLDYAQPLWGNVRLEAGLKTSSSKTDNDLLYETYLNDRWEIDRNQTNHFIYREQIHAAYLNLGKSWGKWSVQAGFRGEYTVSEGEQRTTGAVSDSSYFNLFPSLFVNYAPEGYSLSFSYSRRIRRPSYRQLNPFEIKLDAYSYTSGNPDLTPNYRHLFEWSYINKHNLMVSLSYLHNTDLIVQTPVADERDDQIRYGWIPTNFGTRINFGGMANYRFSPVKRWTVNCMVDAAYVINRSGDAAEEFANDGMLVFVFLNNTFNLGRGFSAELNGLYGSQRTGYVESDPFVTLSTGVRKALLKDRLMITLNVSDVFNTASVWMSSKYRNVNLRAFEDSDSRSVALSLRYSFGSKTVKASRRRTSGIEEEAGRAQDEKK